MTDETVAILNTVLDGITIINMQGEILHINASAAGLSGYSQEEVIGESMAELFIAEKDRPNFFKTFKNIHSDNFIKPVRLTCRHKDGTEFPVIVSLSVIRDSMGYPVKVVAVQKDITRRIQAEKEIEKLQSTLHQANKMEAIGMLACGIAHGFSKIVTAINNFSHLGMKQFQGSVPDAYDIFANVKAASSRASNLTRQLLSFSQSKPAKYNIIDINSLINDLTQMLSSLIGEDIRIQIDLDADLPLLSGDIGKMEQVIMNLVVNARDAMHQGGTISIRTENITIDTTYCKGMPHARPGRFIHLMVKDTGTGISEDNIKHIFEPFFTTRKSGDSAGLGLSVVSDIMEDHKGWINVVSEVGKGTTFEVYLPVADIVLNKESEEMSVIRSLKDDSERFQMVENGSPV